MTVATENTFCSCVGIALSPEIMTTLLRGKLGFNGMVVTDASHMVGMTDRMTRREMLPASINACLLYTSRCV